MEEYSRKPEREEDLENKRVVEGAAGLMRLTWGGRKTGETGGRNGARSMSTKGIGWEDPHR